MQKDMKSIWDGQRCKKRGATCDDKKTKDENYLWPIAGLIAAGVLMFILGVSVL